MIKVIERPSIILKDLSINYEDNIQGTAIDQYSEDIGRYPYIQIGNLTIQTTDTSKITLYNNQFLPKIEIHFKEPTWKLIDPLFPLDDETISLFIRSSSEILMPVRMDFKITNINVVKSNNDVTYVITGLLNVDDIFFTEFYSYQGTSYNVLKTLAKTFKLGFASNIDDTNDEMIWINPADTYLDFIQDVVNTSYKNDESFMYSYIDFFYNLNYIDIETALNEDITDSKGVFFSSNLINDQEEQLVDMTLTDHPDKANSNFFISKYNLLNSSTQVNLDIGYKSYVSYFDKLGNTFYKFIMDTISTPGKNGDNVILKGKVNEVSQITQKSTDGLSMGVIDTDNVHENYVYALVQNKINLDFLQKVKIKITLNIMNFNLYRFQKININFYKLEELNEDGQVVEINEENIKNLTGTDFDAHKINKRLSGEWLITSINYNFNKVGGFTQEVTLVRRELGINENDYQ